ncbi:hypothetical protein DFH09DRAFT_42076 [Mycena vulgaris]|nr:hypothetical protein DFH09DRAFT_42076 [Mycena vulgaris]
MKKRCLLLSLLCVYPCQSSTALTVDPLQTRPREILFSYYLSCHPSASGSRTGSYVRMPSSSSASSGQSGALNTQISPRPLLPAATPAQAHPLPLPRRSLLPPAAPTTPPLLLFLKGIDTDDDLSAHHALLTVQSFTHPRLWRRTGTASSWRLDYGGC